MMTLPSAASPFQRTQRHECAQGAFMTGTCPCSSCQRRKAAGFMSNEKGALWVRYLGGTVVHLAETFPIPTDSVPDRVKKLRARGDVAAIWYTPGVEFKKDAHVEWVRG